MSSYVVDQKTISRVITHLDHDRGLRARMARAMYPVDTDEGRHALGQSMLDLNVLAVNSRYRERSPNEEYNFEYQTVTEIQAHKSLLCWLYQCSEGSVPEAKLMILMERICGEIANSIICKLPSHSQSDWG